MGRAIYTLRRSLSVAEMWGGWNRTTPTPSGLTESAVAGTIWRDPTPKVEIVG